MPKSSNNSYSYPGGVIGFPRQVIRSMAYKDMGPVARSLMIELQDVWAPFKLNIHYSVRRAAKSLGVANGTARNAFQELADHGFISCIEESDWFNGKAREWSLNWLAHNKREPTNEWMDWVQK